MKFLENEVLKSNRSENYPVSEIVGRCWVMYIKDYARGKPKGADMAHVYACENRYNDQGKHTSRIKLWNVSPKYKEPELELYETPLVLVKQLSIFGVAQQEEAAAAAAAAAGSSRKRKMSEEDADSESVDESESKKNEVCFVYLTEICFFRFYCVIFKCLG